MYKFCKPSSRKPREASGFLVTMKALAAIALALAILACCLQETAAADPAAGHGDRRNRYGRGERIQRYWQRKITPAGELLETPQAVEQLSEHHDIYDSEDKSHLIAACDCTEIAHAPSPQAAAQGVQGSFKMFQARSQSPGEEFYVLSEYGVLSLCACESY